jgi:hypothetical protein
MFSARLSSWLSPAVNSLINMIFLEMVAARQHTLALYPPRLDTLYYKASRLDEDGNAPSRRLATV